MIDKVGIDLFIVSLHCWLSLCLSV